MKCRASCSFHQQPLAHHHACRRHAQLITYTKHPLTRCLHDRDIWTPQTTDPTLSSRLTCQQRMNQRLGCLQALPFCFRSPLRTGACDKKVCSSPGYSQQDQKSPRLTTRYTHEVGRNLLRAMTKEGTRGGSKGSKLKVGPRTDACRITFGTSMACRCSFIPNQNLWVRQPLHNWVAIGTVQKSLTGISM